MSEHEAAGDELVPAKRKNLPNRILRAIDDALHLNGLSRSLRMTFAELCRFIPQAEPFATIFAKKQTIADRIGVEVRTVQRHLAALEEQGLIERLDQERKSRNGRFSIARIRLTRKAAELVGLINAETELIHTPRSDNLSTGHTLTEPTISKPQLPPRTENGLPADLGWMTGNGLSRAGIFCLMGLAKAANKRLSDIATAVYDRIKGLKGSGLFAYLAALCKGPTDFAVAAANERKRRQEAEKGRVLARKTELFRMRFRNTCLTNPSHTRLYEIDGSARFVRIHGDARPVTVPLHDLAEWIGRIETGRLVLATLATERRLMA
jgi:DNA-binding transcriptional ArsR family regulator